MQRAGHAVEHMKHATHSLLVALDASPRCVQRLRFGRDLAALLDADLCGMAVLEPRFEPLPLPTRDGVPSVPLLAEVDPQQMRRVRGQVERAGVPLRWIEPGPEPGGAALARRALCADWLLLGQHDAADATTHDVRADLVEAAVIGSGRPAFVLPCAGTSHAVFETIVVDSEGGFCVWGKLTTAAKQHRDGAPPQCPGKECPSPRAGFAGPHPQHVRCRGSDTLPGDRTPPRHGASYPSTRNGKRSCSCGGQHLSRHPLKSEV